jgi:hypothetical protein
MLTTPIGLFLTATLLTAPARPASADATAFWGYWQSSGSTWAFATTGPATAHPADGAVEGWRFARSSGSTGTPPHDRPSFAGICGSATARTGVKRVAVVLDYGDQADAPAGQRPAAARTSCAVVPRDATGSDVLAAVARPSTDKSGLVCAIDGFGPCGTAAAPAASHSPVPPAATKKSPGATGLSAGVGLVLVLATVGGFVALRRRSRP